MATLMQETAHEQRAISSRVEVIGRELARYAWWSWWRGSAS
jgi:hypothetical protein